jgi:hypothetical protein
MQDIAAFIHNNWNAIRAVALNSPPDHVLVVWMGTKNLVINATPREQLIAEDPEAAPEAAKAGPLDLASGAVASIWLAICTPLEGDAFQIVWCSADFMDGEVGPPEVIDSSKNGGAA